MSEKKDPATNSSAAFSVSRNFSKADFAMAELSQAKLGDIAGKEMSTNRRDFFKFIGPASSRLFLTLFRNLRTSINEKVEATLKEDT